MIKTKTVYGIVLAACLVAFTMVACKSKETDTKSEQSSEQVADTLKADERPTKEGD
jgi:hypothetical protein